MASKPCVFCAENRVARLWPFCPTCGTAFGLGGLLSGALVTVVLGLIDWLGSR